MKAKDVKKLLALSALGVSLSSAPIFTSCGCAYGPQEPPTPYYDPSQETAIAEYGVSEILEVLDGSEVEGAKTMKSDNPDRNDTTKTNETSDKALEEAVCVYGPAEVVDETTELKTLEPISEEADTVEFDPSKEEVPSVYGVQESYATE